jgi:NAD-dependent dihydropyrimidine dehydrogenase PreA subunit
VERKRGRFQAAGMIKEIKASINRRRASMNTVKVDMDLCSSCKTCYDACFVNVFRWNEQDEKPIVAYPEDCVECNKCELGCPVNAIEVIPDFKGIYWPPVV